MSRNKWAAIVIILVLAAGAGWLLTQRYVHQADQHQEGAYYCPMHPAYTSDRPGDCPICNMKLVKKEKEPVSGTAMASSVCVRHNCTMANCPMAMMAPPGTKAKCPICKEVIVAPTGDWEKILYWTDPMMPDFKSDKPGKNPMGMELVPVYEEDATLQEGISGPATFMVSPEKQQLIGVKKGLVEKRTLTKEIRTTGMVSYDRERLTLPKESAPETVWVFASLYEYERNWVKPGDPVSVRTEVYPGENFPGVVQQIDSQVDPATRSVRTTIEVENRDQKLTREMYVTVMIHAAQGERVGVPAEAVLDTGERQIVFVVKGESVFEPRAVRLGLRSEEFVEILEGLSEGETVVASATFLIDSESRLKSVVPAEHKHGQ